jgi:hypothetical protein
MVVITGGSWAVGEWQFHKVSGPGVAEHLTTAGVEVINLARSSIGNIEQLESIDSLLKESNNTDVFYWLVHNPLVGVSTQDIYQGKTSLAESIKEQLHKQMTFADTVAKKHNIIINLVGASCDLNDVAMDTFSNLKLRVPSWGQLLTDSYPASIFAHQTDHMTDLKQALGEHRPDLVNEYHKLGGLAFSKRRAMLRAPDMFHSFHPTSLGHEVLSKHLLNFL